MRPLGQKLISFVLQKIEEFRTRQNALVKVELLKFSRK